MKNGLYRIEFGVNDRLGTGTVTYREGALSGGDASFAYVGDVYEDGEQIRGQVNVFQHSEGENVFAGLTNFTLDLQGKQMTVDTLAFQGTTASAPGVPLKLSMQLLRAL